MCLQSLYRKIHTHFIRYTLLDPLLPSSCLIRNLHISGSSLAVSHTDGADTGPAAGPYVTLVSWFLLHTVQILNGHFIFLFPNNLTSSCLLLTKLLADGLVVQPTVLPLTSFHNSLGLPMKVKWRKQMCRIHITNLDQKYLQSINQLQYLYHMSNL